MTEAMQNELDDLPGMAIDLPNALIVVGDALDIDPKEIVRALINTKGTPLDDLRTAHGARDINLMLDLIMEAVDSSTYFPPLLRALELIEAINAE